MENRKISSRKKCKEWKTINDGPSNKNKMFI